MPSSLAKRAAAATRCALRSIPVTRPEKPALRAIVRAATPVPHPRSRTERARSMPIASKYSRIIWENFGCLPRASSRATSTSSVASSSWSVIRYTSTVVTGCFARVASSLLPWIFHVGILIELDVVEQAVDLLDLADVDGLHDVPRLRVDHDRTARAQELHALERCEEPIGID